MLCKRGLCRHVVSVCLSRSYILSKGVNISSFFSPSGSHTILVFPYQTAWRYSDRNLPNGGVECRWGRQKSRFWAIYLASMPAVKAAAGQVLSTRKSLLVVADTVRCDHQSHVVQQVRPHGLRLSIPVQHNHFLLHLVDDGTLPTFLLHHIRWRKATSPSSGVKQPGDDDVKWSRCR